MERKFKVSIKLINFNKEINLCDNLMLIIDTAHNFSQLKDYRIINLLDVKKDMIEIMVCDCSRSSNMKFSKRLISDFLKMIYEAYDVEYISASKNFEISKYEVIPEEEYVNLLRDGTLHIGEMLKKKISEKNNDNIQDCNLQREKYNFQHREVPEIDET